MTRTIRRGVTAIIAAFSLVALTTVAAFACHNTVALVVGDCDHSTGSYFVTATINNSEAHDYEVLSSATIMQSGINQQQVADNAHPLVVTQEYAPGAVLTLTVTGTWPTRNGFAHTDTSNTVTVPDVACTRPPPPHHPTVRHGYIHVQAFKSCAPSQRGVVVVEKHGVARVHLWHNATRTHWSLRAATKPGVVIRRDKGRTGPWVHRIHWAWRHLGTGHKCGHHTPTSGRDPQLMTKAEWNQVAIGDTRVGTVRAICGCTEQGTAYHRTWHGNDYKAYEYATGTGNAFVFFRVADDGSSRAGFQKDWCPGSPVVGIPTGDCLSAWN